MAVINLSSNKGQVIVDDDDLEFLSQKKWRLSSGGYAITGKSVLLPDGTRKKTTIYMHIIVNKTPDGYQTDHINGNRLDNRKSNLRTVTRQQNMFNKKTSPRSISGLKGVGWCKQTQKWKVSIFADGKRRTIGRYPCIEIATKVYNEHAKKYHGEYARLNEVQQCQQF